MSNTLPLKIPKNFLSQLKITKLIIVTNVTTIWTSFRSAQLEINYSLSGSARTKATENMNDRTENLSMQPESKPQRHEHDTSAQCAFHSNLETIWRSHVSHVKVKSNHKINQNWLLWGGCNGGQTAGHPLIEVLLDKTPNCSLPHAHGHQVCVYERLILYFLTVRSKQNSRQLPK